MSTKLSRVQHILALVSLSVLSSAVHAAGYDEAVNGDLSNNHNAPTAWSLDKSDRSSGGATFDNRLTGRIANPDSGPFDRDYVVITVPQGTLWSRLIVGPGTQGGGLPNGQAFIAIAYGSKMPPPDELEIQLTSAGLAGFSTYGGRADFDQDILPRVGNPQSHPYYALFPGATGFKAPLSAGEYTVWLQERAQPGSFPYAFNFVLSSVPEPSIATMAMLGLVGVLSISLRRRRKDFSSRV